MIGSEESLPGALHMPCHSIVREAITAYSSWQLDANVAKKKKKKMKGESIWETKWEWSGDPDVGIQRDVAWVFMLGLGTFELAEQVLPVGWAV